MSFQTKFIQDYNYRKLYGLPIEGDPAGKLYILEFLHTRVTDSETLSFLQAQEDRINQS